MKIVIAGGGISGLSLAEAVLRRRPETEIVVLESEAVPGGKILTEKTDDGFLCEWGVNGFLDNKPKTLELAERLQMGPLRSNDASRKRFLFSGGMLHQLPESPPSFFTAKFLTIRGRLRVMAEPFIRRGTAEDETLESFASRRLGHELFEKLIDPMASGIYAGDGTRLSLPSCFPRIHEMEQQYGSLIRALLAIQRERKKTGGPKAGPAPAGVLTSFRDGMQTMIAGLADLLGPRLRTGSPVTGVDRQGDRWIVATNDGTEEGDRLVLATPAHATQRIMAGFDGDVAGLLGKIPYPAVAVCCLGYRREKVAHSLDGFGFLVPSSEGRGILGTLWDSSIFPNRAPEGFVLLRTMLGGGRVPELALRSEEDIAAAVREELRDILGIDAAPDLVRVYRHEQAIPQYYVGHGALLNEIDDRMAKHPGLSLTGNAYRGIGVNDCIARSDELAERLLA